MAQTTINYSRVNRIISNLATTAFPSELEIGENNSASQIQRGLLLIPFTGIPAGSTLTNVVMQIYNNSNALASEDDTVQVYRLTRDWTAGATWNTYDGSNNWSTAGAGGVPGDRDGTLVGSVFIAAAESLGYKDITLTTSIVQDMFDGISNNYGFMLKTENEGNDLHAYTPGAGAPRWVIDYTPPPSKGVLGYEI